MLCQEKLMKGKRIFFGVIIAATFLIMAQPVISIAAPYSGAWLPNDSDIFTIELTPKASSNSFYMYDWDDSTESLQVIEDGIYKSQTVYFTCNDASWCAGLESGGTTLSLGDTPEFGFYFSNGADNFLSYDLAKNEAGETYILSNSNTEMGVLVSDAAPVPIPASALLLGSGLLGLIAIGRVKKDL